ncbi:type ii secretion system protein e [Lucifera butyrica]|uniref:Type ii secretion system protein e n=1 Tax=Lucifera butyrica TaxID=1351585 RepID=A0A498REP1_9FIRM|nr:ATPase, T2SS/T4P/T4SS family [Lucifera butyrica]VBB08572.1 type ii secretion system protein e [Lucifera butyrica]
MTKQSRTEETLYYLLGDDIRAYLADDNITEVYLNSNSDEIWIDTKDRGRVATGKMMDAQTAANVIYTIADLTGKICNDTNETLAAEFQGIRFQGLLPRVVEKPAFNMRKHCAGALSLEDYVTSGIMTERQQQVLIDAIYSRKNILAAGGTKSGKTTFLNAVLAEIAKTSDRVVLLEDTKELQCAAPDMDRLLTTENKTLEDLLRDTLRLTPERIIVGEVRGAEALILLDAWSTGHKGGASTIHSNSARQTLRRLEELTARAEARAHQYMIGEAIDIIVYLRYSGLKRSVEQILAVDGWDANKEEYLVREL